VKVLTGARADWSASVPLAVSGDSREKFAFQFKVRLVKGWFALPRSLQAGRLRSS